MSVVLNTPSITTLTITGNAEVRNVTRNWQGIGILVNSYTKDVNLDNNDSI